MKIKFIAALLILVFVLSIPSIIFMTKTPAYASTTPDLGIATSFGILSNIYTNTTATILNGDLGYFAGNQPALTPTVSGSTHASDSTYNQAGLDQGSALSVLNAQACDFNFGAATVLSDLPQPLAPGVYCITGATSIGTSVTFSGNGTYIFRTVGALNTAVNSTVTLSGGASACDIFWTPSGATSLGANSTFAGTVIDATAITVGASTLWTGRALAFNGAVTTTTNTITVPTCIAPTATPTPTPTPTANPTPTNAPTATPTPTPTFIPIHFPTATQTSSSPQSTYSAPTCVSNPPFGSPNLFQVDANQTQAILYFTPVANADNYFISYGYTADDQRFGIALQQQSTGVLSYTLNSLAPNTTYYIQIRAGNGCKPGSWGNTMKITTAKKGFKVSITYYKDVISKIILESKDS